jgi:hypothetical protein
MKMEAVDPSETLVTIYLTTRRYIPEDSNLHGHYKCHAEIRNLDVPVAGVKSVNLTIGTYSSRYQIRYIRVMRLVEHAAPWKL